MQTTEQVSESGRQTVISWFPDGYEQATGETLPVGVSSQKDARLWREAHAGDEVAVSATRSTTFADFTEVTVRRGGTGGEASTERVLMVPADDYHDPANRHPLGKHSGRFVVDPARRYADITPPPAPPKPPRTRYRGINLDRLTSNQRNRASRELDQRCRMPDGTTPTLSELVETGSVTGKWSGRGVNGRNEYFVSIATEPEGTSPEGNSALAVPVSKATWDALEAPAH